MSDPLSTMVVMSMVQQQMAGSGGQTAMAPKPPAAPAPNATKTERERAARRRYGNQGRASTMLSDVGLG